MSVPDSSSLAAPVVVGVDGSPCSLAAVDLATREATCSAYAAHRPRVHLAVPARSAGSLAGWHDKYPDVVVHRALVQAAPEAR